MNINSETHQPRQNSGESAATFEAPEREDDLTKLRMPRNVPILDEPQDDDGAVSNTETDWYEP